MARPGFSLDRKFQRCARSLEVAFPGFGEVVARGALELLWDAAYEACDDYVGDGDDLEAQARWRGRPGELVQALVTAGGVGKAGFVEEGGTEWWPEGRPGTYRIHDLWDHAPDYAKKRLERETAREAAGTTLKEQRAAAGRKGAARTNGKRETTEQQADGKRTPLAEQPAATVQQVAGTLAPTLAPAPAQQQQPPPLEREPDEPPKKLVIVDESGPWPSEGPKFLDAHALADRVFLACGRTVPFPTRGTDWAALDASVKRLGLDVAVEVCRVRYVESTGNRRPGSLSYFAKVLEGEGTGPPKARDIRVGMAPVSSGEWTEGERDLSAI